MFVAHSQPSTFGALPALQSMRPALHLYEHVVPLQLAGPVLVLHAAPHAPQFEVDDSDDSQPFVSGAVLSQLAKPAAHPVYRQLPPGHVAPLLVAVSHEWPHAPQFETVARDVSQPFVSGGLVLQSANPGSQFVYLHTAPPPDVSHDAPALCTVSQESPQALHVAEAPPVSQPFVSGGVVTQTANPGLQPV